MNYELRIMSYLEFKIQNSAFKIVTQNSFQSDVDDALFLYEQACSRGLFVDAIRLL